MVKGFRDRHAAPSAVRALPDKKRTVPDPAFEFRVKGGVDAAGDRNLRALPAITAVCERHRK